MSPTKLNSNKKKKASYQIPHNLEKVIIGSLKQSVELTLARSVREAVTENFVSLGLNTTKTQDLYRDLSFLSTLRKRCEESSSLFFRIILSSTIAAMAIALWEGVKVMLRR